ncbi:4129_t:CDS:2, partial [Entrophospora sp. SA101]
MLTPIFCCKVIIVGVFAAILSILSAVLIIGVLNDLPTITTEDTSSICLEHITQPTFLNSQWTGKFSPNKLVFPNTQPFRQLKRILFRFEIDGDGTVNGDFPTFTINIFDSGNMTTAEAMYVEAAKDTYFEESSDTSFVTSIFRGNRLGLNPGSLLSNDEMDTTTANDTLNEMVLVIDDLSTTTANDQDNEIIKKQVNEDTSSICSKHITQPTPLGLHWTGKFLPNNLYFPNTEPKNRLKRILFRFELADDGIIDGDIPTFTINIFDSGSTHVPLFYKNKENSDKNEESSDKNETDVGPIGPWKYLKKWFFITKTHCRLGSILSLFYKKKSGKNETNALMGDYCEEIDASTTTENDKNHQAAIVIDTPTATTNYEIVSEIDESTTTTNDKDDELSLMKNQLDSVTHELSETKQQLDALIELLKHH